MNKIILIPLLLVLYSMSLFAEVKQLRCEFTQHDGEKLVREQTRDFIFDTEDFAKENPEADTILVKTNTDKDAIWIDVSLWEKYGWNVTTFYEIEGVGKTFRTTFEVTPTFLTFQYVNKPDCLVATGEPKLCGNKNTNSMSISRKTLTGSQPGERSLHDLLDNYPPGSLEYSCKLSDYNTSENQL